MAGVIIAGTLVADCIKMIDHYPKKGMFADISDVSYGVEDALQIRRWESKHLIRL